MVETQAPNGYEVAENIIFRVTHDGKVEIKGNDGNWTDVANSTIHMEDKVKLTEKDVNFSKTEINKSEELPGAELKVVRGEGADGDVVQKWTSTDVQKTIKLEEGTYTMVETQAPNGYEVAENIIFRVTHDGKVEIKGNDGNWTDVANSTIHMEDKVKLKMPDTGSNFLLVYITSGLIITITMLFIFFKKKIENIFKKKKGCILMKKQKLLIMIGLATSLFTLEVLPMGLPLINSTVYAAEQTAPTTQNLSVQKVMYEGDKPSITNDGEEKQLPDGAEKFNPEKYGDVEFTLVDITSYFNNKGEKGIQEELNGLTSEEYSNWINTHKEANTTPVTHSVNNDGKVNYDNVLATNQDGTGHVYAILETKSAKGLIEQIAQPIVVSLPMTNVVGNGWLNTINLYPKNKVKSLSFKLTKYGEEISDTNKLAGATFDLYSGVPGNGTKLNKDALTTNQDGVITVENLTKGDYYFVETSAPKKKLCYRIKCIK